MLAPSRREGEPRTFWIGRTEDPDDAVRLRGRGRAPAHRDAAVRLDGSPGTATRDHVRHALQRGRCARVRVTRAELGSNDNEEPVGRVCGPSVCACRCLHRRGGSAMLRDDKALILGLIVDTFGTGAFAASSLIFFVAVRGVDVSEVGLAVTVGTILSFSTLPLAERVVLAIGARNAVAVASAVSTAGLILCGLTVGFWSILAASFVLTVGDRVHSAAWPILASQRFPDSDIAVVFGKFTAIKSATMGTGAALAAVAAYQLGVGAYTLLFVVNMVTTAASILLTLAVPSGRDGGERPSRRLQVWRTLADTRFMTLLISQACLSFVWLAPTTLLPLLIVEHLGLPAGVAALVVAVRYAMIFLLQVPIVNAVHGRSRW
ncbi:MFS transporter [Clavibacter michiganensis subsp. insidiosus]|uniref:MFS transporter n=2 Tax=Clavibacter michiganensis TaxID=28447 RepID=A0A399N3Q6_9MICO|nr:hypothetical protein B5P21_13385 [Clavibacter michiganensis subsp. insidiosus]RII88690.1 MFS transporter [Clavibacter michiganensis subsp. insidiosus]RIJ44823.1 MFS transporter [Clavibacter michiganensis subsp. insidiosus]RMC84220.1 MFS transporter [Clavibacter michiganensis subsp. insidiosus]